MSAPPGSRSAWSVVRHGGTAAELHALELVTPAARSVWDMALTRDALVLGSTQPHAVVDPAVLDDEALDVVRRRSGGGAVLLRARDSFWVDVVVPRDDELWVDDVGRSFDWLGRTWIRALRALDHDGLEPLTTFPGPMRRTAGSELVCFAGLGPGEVTAGGRKVIGLSQRRTRAGARFQCLAYLGPARGAGAERGGAEAIVPLLAAPADPGARTALEAHLRSGVVALDVAAPALLDAFVAALPD